MLQIGDLAPDFTGRIGENDGDVIRLSDYIGQRVVLYFFPYINSYGCTTEACSFRDKWEVIQEEEIVVIGVSANSVKSQRKFAMKHHLPFPLVADTDRRISELYGTRSQNWIYGKTYLGAIRRTFLIDASGKIIKIFDRPNLKIHGQKILDFWSSDQESVL